MGDYVCDKRRTTKQKVAKVIANKVVKSNKINKAEALEMMADMAKRLEDYYDETEISKKQFESLLSSLFSKDMLCMELDELLYE